MISNLYISNPGGGLLGWATFPSSYAGAPSNDGIVVLGDSLPGGDADPYNLGDTGSHEAGHWLGLYHTFQGGCSKQGDLGERHASREIPGVRLSNGTGQLRSRGTRPDHELHGLHGRMCMFLFSSGQTSRMQTAWMTYRFGK